MVIRKAVFPINCSMSYKSPSFLFSCTHLFSSACQPLTGISIPEWRKKCFPVSPLAICLLNWTSSQLRLCKLSLKCLLSLLSASVFDRRCNTGWLHRNGFSVILQFQRLFITYAFVSQNILHHHEHLIL